jgi:hypothetical protein
MSEAPCLPRRLDEAGVDGKRLRVRLQRGCGRSGRAGPNHLDRVRRFGSIKHVRFGELIAKRWPVVGGVLLVAALGGLLWWSPSEPRVPQALYDGHPISYWLTTYDSLYLVGSSPPSPPPASLLADSNAVPVLIRALRRRGWVETKYYREWLWPKCPPAIRAHLPPPNDTIWQNATLFLGQMGSIAKPAIPALIRVLKNDGDRHARRDAALTLGHLGKDDTTVIAALQAALKDDGSVAFGAAWALWRIDHEAAIKVLREHENAEVRCIAAWALGQVGKADQRTVAALKEASSKDPERAVRERALLELARIEPDHDAAVNMLIPLLTGKESIIRLQAVAALGDLGSANPAAMRALTEALKDGDVNVRFNATNVLLEIDPAAAARAGVSPPSQ